jgi:hypothetical protein
MKPAHFFACGVLILCAACSGDDGENNAPDTAAGSGATAGTGGAGTGATMSEAGKAAAGTSATAGGSGGTGGSAAAGKSGSPGGAAGSGGAGTGTTGAAGDSAAAGAGADAAGTPGMMGSRAADGTNPNAVNPYPDYKSEIYGDDKMWMCKPGLAKNYCLTDIADATEALPDGTFKPSMDTLSDDHPFDCIFWYPTVNRTEEPTSLDFSDPEPMLGSIRSQAARFSRVCNVYAPFYRQVSLNNGGDSKIAFQDVVDSFKQYISQWNKGRYFIVFGHSQGTGHATKLIQQEIDDKPELRERMISALLIGGGLTATTFKNIPLCEKPDQFGCAVGYRTYGAPKPPTASSNVPAGLACVNPAAMGGGKAMLKGSYFHSKGSNYAPALGADFTAHFGLFRGFFTGECKDAPGGGKVLEIDYSNMSGDMRKHFLDITREYGFGLHVFDYNFLMDDLLDLVKSQEDAMVKAKP